MPSKNDFASMHLSYRQHASTRTSSIASLTDWWTSSTTALLMSSLMCDVGIQSFQLECYLLVGPTTSYQALQQFSRHLFHSSFYFGISQLVRNTSKQTLGQAIQIHCFTSATYSICMWVSSHYHYSLLANAIYTQQIYSATAIKVGVSLPLNMTVEAVGLS